MIIKNKLTTILKKLKSLANKKNLEGMARYGINTKNAYGVTLYQLRDFAKEIGFDHALALQLYDSGIHEALILASIVDEPELVTEQQMENWVKDFDSWDVCDQVCTNLFDRTKFAYTKAKEWSLRKEEFIKRAGFTIMAGLAVHDIKATDDKLARFFPIIKRESTDERNFVKKAVNWALRNIGKRNLNLNKLAIKIAKEIKEIDSKSARWIAADALRELTGEKVQKRIKNK